MGGKASRLRSGDLRIEASRLRSGDLRIDDCRIDEFLIFNFNRQSSIINRKSERIDNSYKGRSGISKQLKLD